MNKQVIIADKTYKLVSYVDSDEHGNEMREYIKTIVSDMTCVFDSSYKNQLLYISEDNKYLFYCIDYRYGFNRETCSHDLINIVDEIVIYKLSQDSK